MDKREFLKTGALAGTAAMFGGKAFAQTMKPNFLGNIVGSNGEYTLPPLGYDYNALEPHIDSQTMKLHHDIHHNGYVKGLNNATKMVKSAIESNDYSLIKHWERELAFHGSGHFLHSLFWKVMGPKQGKRSSDLEKYINKSFGSFDKFKDYYFAASKSVEGSGWGILCYEPFGDKLVVLQAEKHHNLTQQVNIPILPVDVWEHAYYLKYQNKRGDYINAFFNIINWEFVSEYFDSILGSNK
jgi:Fe-Mn family superoxide dismutase